MMSAWPWCATLRWMLKPILVSKSKHAVSEYVWRVMSKLSLTCSSSVYKVRVDSFYEDLSTDIHTVRILESIKEGGCLTSDPDVQEGGGRPVTIQLTHHEWHFVSRKLRCESSGQRAIVPQLSTLQGLYRLSERKNLPHHGDVHRHSQRWERANVSLFHLTNLFLMIWFLTTLSVSAELLNGQLTTRRPESVYSLLLQVPVCARWEDLDWVLAHTSRVSDWRIQTHLSGHRRDGWAVYNIWMPK